MAKGGMEAGMNHWREHGWAISERCKLLYVTHYETQIIGVWGKVERKDDRSKWKIRNNLHFMDGPEFDTLTEAFIACECDMRTALATAASVLNASSYR